MKFEQNTDNLSLPNYASHSVSLESEKENAQNHALSTMNRFENIMKKLGNYGVNVSRYSFGAFSYKASEDFQKYKSKEDKKLREVIDNANMIESQASMHHVTGRHAERLKSASLTNKMLNSAKSVITVRENSKKLYEHLYKDQGCKNLYASLSSLYDNLVEFNGFQSGPDSITYFNGIRESEQLKPKFATVVTDVNSLFSLDMLIDKFMDAIVCKLAMIRNALPDLYKKCEKEELNCHSVLFNSRDFIDLNAAIEQGIVIIMRLCNVMALSATGKTMKDLVESYYSNNNGMSQFVQKVNLVTMRCLESSHKDARQDKKYVSQAQSQLSEDERRTYAHNLIQLIQGLSELHNECKNM
ncbi:hypothetical protein AB837_00278 [bacterium AB1]|nr:hypothetical protein AB837_00278 [bacterium AB1]